MIAWWQILLLTLYAGYQIMDELNWYTCAGSAVFSGMITGLIMGDLQTGLFIGGSMQLTVLGVGTFGGASRIDANSGTLVATAFAVGAGIAIIINNLLLVPVLAAGMMFLPFWYIKLTAGYYRKAVTAELETALSIITTAYLRSEDLQTAVEENINYLNPPVQGVFRSFLTRIKHIDPDMNAALAELKSAIDNEVWREWCEALSACQYDHSMKSTLNPLWQSYQICASSMGSWRISCSLPQGIHLHGGAGGAEYPAAVLSQQGLVCNLDDHRTR